MLSCARDYKAEIQLECCVLGCSPRSLNVEKEWALLERMERQTRQRMEAKRERRDLPDKVLRCDNASRDSVAKGVQLNSLVRLQVFLS